MCLTIPGKIVSIERNKALISQAGNTKHVDISLIDAKIGEYVLVQADMAVQKISKQEAEESIRAWKLLK
ncbi:unnamed protein product [marine sediment metagenome]|uniref:HypC/HybG/HupF family hydrogenase formation chaperone n=1 Tax=marine sediment metagenome TaxID=412755 RepID=X1RHH1_9ZZZZ